MKVNATKIRKVRADENKLRSHSGNEVSGLLEITSNYEFTSADTYS